MGWGSREEENESENEDEDENVLVIFDSLDTNQYVIWVLLCLRVK